MIAISQLFVACQVRQGDLAKFFSYENHPWLPSGSQHEKISLPNCKSKLLDCLDAADNTKDIALSEFDADNFNGPAIS